MQGLFIYFACDGNALSWEPAYKLCIICRYGCCISVMALMVFILRFLFVLHYILTPLPVHEPAYICPGLLICPFLVCLLPWSIVPHRKVYISQCIVFLQYYSRFVPLLTRLFQRVEFAVKLPRSQKLCPIQSPTKMAVNEN